MTCSSHVAAQRPRTSPTGLGIVSAPSRQWVIDRLQCHSTTTPMLTARSRSTTRSRAAGVASTRSSIVLGVMVALGMRATVRRPVRADDPGRLPKPPGAAPQGGRAVWHPGDVAAPAHPRVRHDRVASGIRPPRWTFPLLGPRLRVSAGLAALSAVAVGVAAWGPDGLVSWLPLFALVSVVAST